MKQNMYPYYQGKNRIKLFYEEVQIYVFRAGEYWRGMGY
jgi:hypothetical protein